MTPTRKSVAALRNAVRSITGRLTPDEESTTVSFGVRVAVAVEIAVAYVLVFLTLEPSLGSAVAALSLLPVVAIGWLLGMRAALFAGLLGFPLNGLLLVVTGSPLWDLTLNAVVVLGSTNALVAGAVIGRLHDLNEQVKTELAQRRQAEAALHEREARYRLLAENASDVIWTMDTSLRFTYVSPSVQRLRGYTVEEAMAQTPEQILTPASLETATRAMANALALEDSERDQMAQSATLELQVIRKDGSVVWTESTFTPLRDADGKLVGIQGVTRNIEARKQVEQALQQAKEELEERVAQRTAELQEANARLQHELEQRRQAQEAFWTSEQQFRTIFNNAAMGIALIDLAGHPMEANRALLDMLGYSAQELSQKTFAEFTHPEDRPVNMALFQELAEGRRDHYQMEKRFVRKDGSVGWGRLTVSLSRDSEGRPEFIIAMMDDITEHKEAEEQLLQAEKLRSLGQLASGVAHDFNNVLAPILGFSELLLTRRDIVEDKERSTHYLRMINTAAQDASQVVRRLREFYRTHEDTDVLGLVDLNHLVEDTINLTKPKWKGQAQARGTNIIINKDLGDIPLVAGNESGLREVLTNLIFNAVDAMPAGGEITITTRHRNRQVLLSVRDSGVGMTREVKQRCMEPFFSTKGDKGTGMGLAMVYGIIRRHKGYIEIDTEPGRGTTFTISLVPGTQTKAPPTDGKQERDDTPPSPLHILAVDDEPLVLVAVAQSLLAEGHTVETASSGREALERLREGKFDIVLTDRAMADINGDQLAYAVKQVAPAMPVVMLTGFGDMMKLSGDLPKHVDLVLSKPITLKELREALRRFKKQAA